MKAAFALAAAILAVAPVTRAENPLVGPALSNPGAATVTGNGGLTVGCDGYGQVTTCTWPSPGFYEQLSRPVHALGGSRGTQIARGGLRWGIQTGERTCWLSGEPWQATTSYPREDSVVLVTTATCSEPAMTATQTLFVHPERDLLVVRLEVEGLSETPTVVWHADFSPCTRLVPELAFADWLLVGLNDFAAFADAREGVIYHFRPERPGSADWDRAANLAARDAPTEDWARFSDGVWIGYTTPDRVEEMQCRSTDDGTPAQASSDISLQGADMGAVGQCDSAISIIPEKGDKTFTATVFAAFGRNQAEVKDGLAFAKGQGYEQLLDSCRSYWHEWLKTTSAPATGHEPLDALANRSLLALALATDRMSGATVSSPGAPSSFALDWPRDGVWVTLAWDFAGRHDLAENHISFYLRALRTHSARGKPSGSLPVACYADQRDGLPHLLLDLEAPAWLLWSIWKHGTFLESESRSAFWRKVWDEVVLCADFLAAWADARTGAPLPAFDPTVLRDSQSANTAMASYLGVDSALRIARALGAPEPESWRSRKSDLDAWIRFGYLHNRDAWRQNDMLTFRLTGILRHEKEFWESVADYALADLTARHGAPDAGALCAVAAISQDYPAKRDWLDGELARGFMNVERPGAPLPGFSSGRPAAPATRLSALCFVAASILSGNTL